MNFMKLKQITSLITAFILVSFLIGCKNDDSGNSGGVLKKTIDLDKDGFISTVDCDDNDAAIYTLSDLFVDSDQDGYGTANLVEVCVGVQPVPLGYSLTSNDPNDSNANMTPLDVDGDLVPTTQDCDDTDATKTIQFEFFKDLDGDGFGSLISGNIIVCGIDMLTGYVTNSQDTDDNNAAITPNDLDGDLVLNENDCAPTNKDLQIQAMYFADVDSDGIGAGAGILTCVSQSAPDSINGLVKTSGDSCPTLANRNMDWDLDGTDDVCDNSIVVTKTIELKKRTSETSSTFQVGQESQNQIEILFKESGELILEQNVTLEVLNNVLLKFEDDSKLVINNSSELQLIKAASLEMRRTQFNNHVVFQIGHAALYDSEAAPVLKGINHVGSVNLMGVELTTGVKARIDGIRDLTFNKVELRDPSITTSVVNKTFGVNLRQMGGFDYDGFLIPANGLVISKSPSENALIVSDHYVELANVHFQENLGHGLKCSGHDYVKPHNYSQWFRRRFVTTCQSAMRYAFFSNNLYNGIVLATEMTARNFESAGVTGQNEFTPAEFSAELAHKFAGQGTSKIYIDQATFDYTNSNYFVGPVLPVSFKNVELLAEPHNLSIGNDWIPKLVFKGDQTSNSYYNLAFIFDSDLTDIILSSVGARLYIKGSILGTVDVVTAYDVVLYYNGSYLGIAKSDITIFDSTIDLSNSRYFTAAASGPNSSQLCGVLLVYENEYEDTWLNISDTEVIGASGVQPFCYLTNQALPLPPPGNNLYGFASSVTYTNIDINNLWLGIKSYGGPARFSYSYQAAGE